MPVPNKSNVEFSAIPEIKGMANALVVMINKMDANNSNIFTVYYL